MAEWGLPPVFLARYPFMGASSARTSWALPEGPAAHNHARFSPGAEGGETGGSCHRSSAQSCLFGVAATFRKASLHHSITRDSCGGGRSL